MTRDLCHTPDYQMAMNNLNQIRVLGLKATFLCNSRCGFCWQPHRKREADISPKALDNLSPLITAGGLKIIQPAGGEIFLWRPLIDFLQYVESYNKEIKMYLVTNGTLFDTYWYHRVESGFISTVSLSVNAPTRDLYQKISGRDNFLKVKHAIDTLSEIKKKTPFTLQISFVMTRPLLGKLNEFVTLAAGKADTLLIRKWRAPSIYEEDLAFYRENHIPAHLEEEMVCEILRTHDLATSQGLCFDYSQYSLDVNRAPIFSPFQTPSYEFTDQRCVHLDNQIQVEHTGNVRLGCNFSGQSIGNLNDKNIVEILADPSVNKIRERVVGNKDYLFCPPKMGLFSCPFSLREIQQMKGINRYITELPRFAFVRNSRVMLQPRILEHYRKIIAGTVELLTSSTPAHVAEYGYGPLTPVMVAVATSYWPCRAVDPRTVDHIRKYMTNCCLPNADKYVQNTNNPLRNKDKSSFSVVVLNENATEQDVIEATENVISDGHLVVHAGIYHHIEIRKLLITLLESPEWLLVHNFGYLTFCFKKTLSSKSRIHQALRDTYSDVMQAVDSMLLLQKKGIRKIALFGAGRHTRWLQTFSTLYLGRSPQIIAIVDDHPDINANCFNMCVTKPSALNIESIDAILLSTNDKQKIFFDRCRLLYGEKVRLIDLYATSLQ
ncbi:radical SAM protein [Chrysiogenes arsenatis]|uniref:radical SAM protein n=1 Tax=Chrysiogenes arsenatis TaxID=309797 RepID=UPI000409D4EB|nr:radical SAM protein [Chrysiogenes arsenatis]